MVKRPLRLYHDKKGYFIRSGKQKHYIGKTKKTTPTIINKIFNVINGDIHSKSKRRKRRKKKDKPVDGVTDGVDPNAVDPNAVDPNAVDPNNGLTPYDQRRQRNLFLTDALAQKFITRDGLSQLESRDQQQQQNDSIPPALNQQENQLLQWKDDFARLVEMRGRIGALQAQPPPFMNMLPNVNPSATITEIDSDPGDNDDDNDNEEKQSNDNTPIIPPVVNPITPLAQRKPITPIKSPVKRPRRRNRRNNEQSSTRPQRGRNASSLHLFAMDAKSKMLDIYPKNKAGRRYITKNKRIEISKFIKHMEQIGLRFDFTNTTQTGYINGIDDIISQLKADGEKGDFIKRVIKTYVNGFAVAIGKSGIYKDMSVSGSGDSESSKNGTALWNTELLSLLSDNKYFAGICMRDEISDLMKKADSRDALRVEEQSSSRPFKVGVSGTSGPNKKFGFIYNTDKKGMPGSHWRAIWVDMIDGKHICHYDSFGDAMEPDIKNVLKTYVKNTPEFLKLKENRVCHQRKASNRCGYHCVLFLDRMSHGMSFIDATDVNELLASDLENKFKKFNLI